MITPMQELFDWISDNSHKSMYDGKELSITDILRKAESLLEKEEEMIIKTSKNSYICGYLDNQAKVDDSMNFPQQYYNETFNTKER